MWCVVYAGEGRERKTEEFIKGRLPESAYSRCFHLVQRLAYRKQGRVAEVVRDCFPGYVFIETQKPDIVQKSLKGTLGHLLFSNSEFISSLDGKEEALLGLLCDSSGEIGLSVARLSVDGDNGRKKAQFLSGPLAKAADRVEYVDFHGRCARLGGSFLNGKISLKLGFRFEDEKI